MKMLIQQSHIAGGKGFGKRLGLSVQHQKMEPGPMCRLKHSLSPFGTWAFCHQVRARTETWRSAEKGLILDNFPGKQHLPWYITCFLSQMYTSTAFKCTVGHHKPQFIGENAMLSLFIYFSTFCFCELTHKNPYLFH